MCPGTDIYMPPEAVKDKPEYTDKIDCFSFGVIAVQIVTRQFPKPGDRHITLNDPRYPQGVVKLCVPEIERRQNHISTIDPNIALKRIALDCLKDSDIERLSAQQLCERVAALKEDPQYSESVRVVETRSTAEQDSNDDRDRELRSLRQQHSQQVQGLQQIIQSQISHLAEKDQTIARKEQTIAQNCQTLREKDETITQKDETIAELREQIRKLEKVLVEEKEREQRQKMDELGSLRQQCSQQVRGLQQIIQSQIYRLAEKDQILMRKEQTITQISQTLREKDEVIAQKDETIAELGEQTRQLEREKRVVVAEKERELRQKVDENDRLKRQLEHGKQQLAMEESEQIDVQFQRRIVELEQLRLATDASSYSKEQNDTIKLTWWNGSQEAPYKVSDSYCAAVSGSILYIHHTKHHQMLTYDTSISCWSKLPYSPTKFCSIVIINNLLTLVGGRDHGGALSNQLFSLTGEGIGRRWTEEFPPMPTKREVSTALCTGTTLIVAGGWVLDVCTQRVEVLNSETLQWSTAADLPQTLSYAPAAVCGDEMYIMGEAMYTCSVEPLLASTRSRDGGIWKKVAAPPVTQTTCVSIHGQLLVIGGRDSDGDPTSAIHMYNPTTDSWEVISHMGTPRCDCIAAVLPNNQLMVVGGYTSIFGTTDSVEFASVG